MANKKISQFTSAGSLQSTDKFLFERGSAYYYVTPANFISFFDSDDITAGSTNKYATTAVLDAYVATKDSDDLAEGSTNLYATTANLNSWLSGKSIDNIGQGTSFRKISYTSTSVDAVAIQALYTTPKKILTNSMTYATPIAVSITLEAGSVAYTTTGNVSLDIIPGNGTTFGGVALMKFPVSILTTTVAYSWRATDADSNPKVDIPMNYDWYIRPDAADPTLGDCTYTIRCWYEEWN